MPGLLHTITRCLLFLFVNLILLTDASKDVPHPNRTTMPEKCCGRDTPFTTLTYYSTSWYTIWVDTDSDDEGCGCHGDHHHHRPCPIPDQTTVFVVPETVTETESKTIYTRETIPVMSCNRPNHCCHRRPCHEECEVVIDGCHTITRTRPVCDCIGGSTGSASTASVPAPPPVTSVIVLSTSTKSIVVITDPTETNDAPDCTKDSFFIVCVLLAVFIATL